MNLSLSYQNLVHGELRIRSVAAVGCCQPSPNMPKTFKVSMTSKKVHFQKCMDYTALWPVFPIILVRCAYACYIGIIL